MDSPSVCSVSQKVVLIANIQLEKWTHLTNFFSSKGYEIQTVANSEQTLISAQFYLPSLILLNSDLAPLDAYQVCQKLKTQASTRFIPILFLGDCEQSLDKIKLFAVGGSDYLLLAYPQAEIFARLDQQLYNLELQRHLLIQIEQLQQVIQECQQLEVALSQAKEAANRAKNEFLANMSHELHTPLTAILGFTEVLLDEIYGNLTLKQKKFLQSIDRNGKHLLELIDGVLELAKAESGNLKPKLEPTDLRLLCQEVLSEIYRKSQEKQIDLSLEISPQIGLIDLDKDWVYQILLNLLTNGVKFTPIGGKIEIEITPKLEHQDLEIRVRDTGIGIAPEDQKRLFQPFVQLDGSFSRRYEGTGLGLTLIKRLVELHGGMISLESQVNCGSQFTVSLPWRSSVETSRNLAS